MAGKMLNSSFVLLSKFVANRKERASKTATSHIRKTLPTRRSRHAAKELQIANTRAIAKICNTFALADPQMKIE
jgi:hypothetical protein